MRLPGRISSAVILAVLTAPTVDADSSDPLFEDVTPADCALLEDDQTRLACYDSFIQPTREKLKAQDSPLGTQSSEDTAEDNSFMDGLVDRYLAAEQALFSFSGSFVTHKPTYILPYSYNHSPNRTPFSPRTGFTEYDERLKKEEAKFQISFKVPLLTGLFDDRTTLWFGYTQRSFWQVYSTDASAPFRETNFEPELFMRYAGRWKLGPGRLESVSVGLNHQSNGQPEPQSRSWNRLKGQITYGYDRWLFVIEPWWRIPEPRDEDDNSDIDRYLGYANYWAIYKLSDTRTLSLRLRNNLRSEDNKTSFELGYSFPMGDTLKGFVQYHNGYGESLIDYNHRVHRIGVGVMLNDWL